MAGTMSIVEHVVFFKVKQNVEEEKKVAMVRELRALQSLEGVLHLTAGPVFQRWPKLTGGYTHILHSRYADKAALATYSAHPSHLGAVRKFVLPISDDLLAMDWEAQVAAPLESRIGAKRVVACKLKDGFDAGDTGKLLDQVPGKAPASAGVNFSPARAKGFNFAALSLLDSVDELDNPEILEETLAKKTPLVESLLVLDYANLDDGGDGSESSAKM